MVAAFSAGLGSAEFWGMTAYETNAYCKARGGADLRMRVTQGWMTANWSRAKRMPSLNAVLAKIDRSERGKDLEHADERVMAAVRHLAAMGSAGEGRP